MLDHLLAGTALLTGAHKMCVRILRGEDMEELNSGHLGKRRKRVKKHSLERKKPGEKKICAVFLYKFQWEVLKKMS
jgi:hypothetical protein